MRFTHFREMLAFHADRSPDAPALFYENEILKEIAPAMKKAPPRTADL